MKRSTEKRITIVFWVVLSILAIARLLLYTTTTRYIDNSQRIEHSRAIIQEMQVMLSSVQDAETGQRGFLLTGKEEYLAPWNSSMMSLPKSIETLRTMLADDPEQAARLEKASDLSAQRVAQAHSTIDTFRAQGSDPAIKRVGTGRGKQLMDQFRAVMGEMLDVENKTLSGYIATAHAGRTRGVMMFGAFTLIDFAVLSTAFWFIYRYATARDRAEAALRESAQLQQAILDNAGSLIITGDTSGGVQIFNRAAEKKLGYRAADVVGNSDWPWVDRQEIGARLELLAKELGHPVAEPLEAFIGRTRSGETDEMEWNFITKSGARLPVRMLVTQMRDGENNVLGYCGIASDITDQRRVQQAMRDAKDAAEAANRTKSLFLANMSHELRTPLNAIIGYSEMLVEDAQADAKPQTIEDINRINRSGKHLLALINDILDLSKVEAGKMVLHLETFSVATIVQEVASTVRPMLKQNRDELKVEVDAEIGEMHADLTKVRQILFNLLSNAAKFTQDGAITLAAKRVTSETASEIRFIVSDTGIGITAPQQQALFQAFNQADASTSSKFGGTGLGLSISRQFCRLMGGDIEVSSAAGKGSVFTVRLPARVADVRSSADTPIEATATSSIGVHPHTTEPGDQLSSGTVLVIDDDPTAQDLMRRLLEADGFRVVLAATGDEGLQLARELRPTAITLDVMMPGLDGWSVLTSLKSDSTLREIPVVMLSIVDDKSMGYSLGASAFLTKPVNRAELLRVMNRYGNAQAKTILIVEDDASSADLVSRALSENGWDVRVAADGQVGLEMLQERSPSIILLDLMMPRMDGFEFTAQLRRREEWREIPVVVLTAKELTADDRQRLHGFVEKIIQKAGSSGNEIAALVRDLIRRRATGELKR